MANEIPLSERKIIMTVARFEAEIKEAFEKGRAFERETAAARERLDYAHNTAIDRFKSYLPEVLKANNILLPKEEVKS